MKKYPHKFTYFVNNTTEGLDKIEKCKILWKSSYPDIKFKFRKTIPKFVCGMGNTILPNNGKVAIFNVYPQTTEKITESVALLVFKWDDVVSYP